MKRVVINLGFITNSSSVIHWYPRAILDDPEVAAFLAAYEIRDGFVGASLWHRGQCGSFLVSEAQRQEALVDLASFEDCSAPAIGGTEHVTVIYGDEYQTLASELARVLEAAAERLKLGRGSDYYN